MWRKGHDGLFKAPTKEERRGRLRGEGDKIKFSDLRFEKWEVVGIWIGRLQDFHILHVLGMNDDL